MYILYINIVILNYFVNFEPWRCTNWIFKKHFPSSFKWHVHKTFFFQWYKNLNPIPFKWSYKRPFQAKNYEDYREIILMEKLRFSHFGGFQKNSILESGSLIAFPFPFSLPTKKIHTTKHHCKHLFMHLFWEEASGNFFVFLMIVS